MSNLFENGQTDLSCSAINIGYNYVLVLAKINEKFYVFSIETYPQSDSQKTVPVQASPIDEVDIPFVPNVPIREEFEKYWQDNILLNADGTRKGGRFGSANLGVAGSPIRIGDVINFDVIENTYKNTIIQINSFDWSVCKIKAYACQTPSPQAVVDTPNFVEVDGKLHVYVIARGLPAKSVDFPSDETTKSIALAGGGFVNGDQTVKQAHDAEANEEGAAAKTAVVMKTFDLPKRITPFGEICEDTRYNKFSYIGKDGFLYVFGENRGRTNSIQIRYFGTLSEKPAMYKAHSSTEVLSGYWMLVDEFLELTNDPTSGSPMHVPWCSHQEIVRNAIKAIAELD